MFIEITEFTGNKLHINTDHIVSFNKNINGTTIRMINGETIIVNVSIDDFKKYYLKMKSVNIASIIIWGKEIIQKIAVINYAINQKMKLQFN